MIGDLIANILPLRIAWDVPLTRSWRGLRGVKTWSRMARRFVPR